MNSNDQIDYSKPVAYDANGQPLYAYPPVAIQTPQANQFGYASLPATPPPPQATDYSAYSTVVDPYSVAPQPTPAPATFHPSPYAVPPVPVTVGPIQAPTPAPQYDPYPSAPTPAPFPVSSEQRSIKNDNATMHAESLKKYPSLNLSAGEYVISEVSRHPAGLLGVALAATFLVILIIGFLVAYPVIFPSGNPPFQSLLMPAILLLSLIGLLTYIVVWVFENNRFYLTNEAIIQEIQTSLFGHNEQSVSLGNVEDASYTQSGFREMMFNYGSIRLSTQGDETSYRFTYVSNPKEEIKVLNNAVESFKNGRPVVKD